MKGLDDDGWAQRYRELEKPLYNVVYRWLWDAAESQDVVQEAFLRCWRIRDRVRADGFRALVFRTALRLASNERRRKRLWQWVTLTDTDELRMASTQPEPMSKAVRDAIDELPDSLKRVLILSEVAGMGYREIAVVLNTREGTVGSRRNRAIARLRQNLEKHGVDWNED